MIRALQNTSHQLLGIRRAGWAERGQLSQGKERLCPPHLGKGQGGANTTAWAGAHREKKDYFTKKRDNFTSLGQSPIYSSLSLCLIWHHPSFQGMSPCRNVWHLWGNWTPISPPVPAPGWQFSFENLVLYEDLFINHQRKKRKQEIRWKKPNLSWFIWSVGVEHDSCFISSNTCTQFCQETKNCTQWIALADLRHWETSFTPSPLQ